MTERPKSAKTRLLELEWQAMALRLTPKQKLDRLALFDRLRRMSIRELGNLWLDASRGFWRKI
jgi:hypothetical protein